MEELQDDIPATRELSDVLTWRDGLAMMSFLVWIMLCLLPGFLLLVQFDRPGTQQGFWHYFWLLFAMGTVTVTLTYLGKYVWLFAMSRIVDKAHVGPLVAFGVPRRISKFDRKFINRHFRPRANSNSSELRSTDKTERSSRTTARAIRSTALAYLFGSVFAFFFSFLPSMQGDGRHIGLAIFFGILGLFHLWAENYIQKD
jgi:hypothetical protein